MSQTGGGIVITGTVGSTFYQIDMPYLSSCSFVIPRLSSSAQSLTGTVIRQATAKHQSGGTATYKGYIPSAEADKLRTLDEGATSCVLSDGFRVYECQLDAAVNRGVSAGRSYVEVVFSVVRQIL